MRMTCCVSPVSVELKDIPADVIEKFSPGFLQELTEQILPTLEKERGSIVRNCIYRVVRGFYDDVKRHEHVFFKIAHPVLLKFIREKMYEYYEYSAKFNNDQWFP